MDEFGHSLSLAIEQLAFKINSLILKEAPISSQTLYLSFAFQCLIQIFIITSVHDVPWLLRIVATSHLIQIVPISISILLLLGIIFYHQRHRFSVVYLFLKIIVLVSQPLLFLSLLFLNSSIQQDYLPLLVVGVLNICLLICIVVPKHIIHFNANLATPGPESKIFNRTLLVERFLFCLILTLDFHITSDLWTSIFTVMLSAVCLWEVGVCIHCHYFMNADVQTVYSIFCIMKANASLINTLDFLQFQIIHQNRYVAACLLIIFECIFQLAYCRYKTLKLLLKDTSTFESDEETHVYLLCLLRLNEQSQGALYFKGLLHSHKQTCTDKGCVCHNEILEMSTDSAQVFSQRILQNAMKIFPHSFLLKALEIYTHIDFLKVYPQASEMVAKLEASKRKLSFIEKWIVYDIRCRLNDLVEVKTKVCVRAPVQTVFLYDKLRNSIREQINLYAETSREKLNLCLQSIVELDEVEKVCHRQLAHFSNIENMYAELQKISPKNIEVRELMQVYAEDLLLDQGFAEKIKAQVFKIQRQQLIREEKELDEDNLDRIFEIQNACVIELSSELENLGRIVECSTHFQKVFGFQKEKALDKKINIILPDLLQKQFLDEMKEWHRTGWCTFMERPIQYFAMDRFDTLFRARFLMKILVKNGNIRILLWIKRQDSLNYGILHLDGRIDMLGSRLKTICQCVSGYFQILSPMFMNELTFMQNNPKHMHRFQSHIVVGNPELVKQMVYRFNKFETDVLPNLQDPEDCIDPQFRAFAEQQIETLLSKSKKAVLCDIEMKFFSHQGKPVCIVLRLVGMQNSSVKEFVQVYTGKPSWIQGVLEKYQQRKGSDNDFTNLFRSTQNLSQDIGLLLRAMEHDSMDEARTEESGRGYASIESQEEIIAASSVRDSVTLDYSFRSLMKDIKGKFSNPKPSAELEVFNIIAFLICVSLISILLGQYLIGVYGLASFQDVIFADGAVSDNMQLLEMFYGKAIQLFQYYDDPDTSRFDYIIKNAKSLSNYLYSLVALDYDRLNLDKIYTGRRFYQYLDTRIPLSLNSGQITVTTGQFMMSYYNSIIVLQETMGRRSKTSESEEAINLLIRNWPTMKSINHGNLAFYADMGKELLSFLSEQIYILMGLYLTLSLFKVIKLYLFMKKSAEDQDNSVLLYENVSHQELLLLRAHVKKFMKRTRKMSSSQLQMSERKDSNGHMALKKRKFSKKKRSLNLLWFILLLVSLNLASFINSGIIVLFLPSCQDMMTSINSLMDSENYLLEGLFDLKTYYLYSTAGRSVEEFTLQFNSFMKQNQIGFHKAATDSLLVFGPYDSAYKSEFVSMLIQNVCDVVVGTTLEDWELQKCKDIRSLHSGILSAMNALQRSTFEASVFLAKNPKEAQNLFRSDVYEEIDDSIIYMFKVYQLTQARMVVALDKAIKNRMKISLMVSLVDMVAICGFFVYWRKFYQGQRQVQAQIHGFILLMSPKIIKENKYIKSYIVKELHITTA